MNIKVSYVKGDLKYYIHGTTTVCTLKFTIIGLQELLDFLPYEEYKRISKKLGNQLLPFTYFTVKGVAKCNSEDTYSEQKGLHIAETRAKAKAYHKAQKVLKEIAASLCSIWQDTLKAKSNCFMIEQQELKHLTDLCE